MLDWISDSNSPSLPILTSFLWPHLRWSDSFLTLDLEQSDHVTCVGQWNVGRDISVTILNLGCNELCSITSTSAIPMRNFPRAILWPPVEAHRADQSPALSEELSEARPLVPGRAATKPTKGPQTPSQPTDAGENKRMNEWNVMNSILLATSSSVLKVSWSVFWHVKKSNLSRVITSIHSCCSQEYPLFPCILFFNIYFHIVTYLAARS